MIEKYNKYMGGVDKSDQFLRYHSSLRRATRYWKTLFYHMLDVAVTNAFVIYNWHLMEKGVKAISENKFRDALVLQLLAKCRHQSDPPATDSISSSISELPEPQQCRVQHGSTIGPQRARCTYCQQGGITSWTSRRCTDCPFIPALCQTPQRDCHGLWHSPQFDISRSMWFYKMLPRQNVKRVTSVQKSINRGRPVGAINKKRRRGLYRKK